MISDKKSEIYGFREINCPSPPKHKTIKANNTKFQ